MGVPSFEGEAVVRSTVRITKAGDGLSEALKLAPIALHRHDEVFFVLKGRVAQVNHKGAEDDCVRVHTVDAIEVAMVEASEVAELLADAAQRVERAKDEARLAEEREAGILRLDDVGHTAAHEAGDHAGGLVDGCEACDAEKAAAADEAGDELAKKRQAKK